MPDHPFVKEFVRIVENYYRPSRNKREEQPEAVYLEKDDEGPMNPHGCNVSMIAGGKRMRFSKEATTRITGWLPFKPYTAIFSVDPSGKAVVRVLWKRGRNKIGSLTSRVNVDDYNAINFRIIEAFRLLDIPRPKQAQKLRIENRQVASCFYTYLYLE